MQPKPCVVWCLQKSSYLSSIPRATLRLDVHAVYPASVVAGNTDDQEFQRLGPDILHRMGIVQLDRNRIPGMDRSGLRGDRNYAGAIHYRIKLGNVAMQVRPR